jgi:SAM-dependent methyltransferase
VSPEAYTEMAAIQSAHWWYVARRRILESQIRSLSLPPDARILEIGSGTGANLDLLATFGEVTGLEMSPQAIALARQGVPSPRVRLVQGRCPDDLSRVEGAFDLICLLDVLEHIDGDAECLARLAGRLAPGGRILLTVPAHAWLWGPHDVQMHHRRRYSARGLRGALRSAGLQALRLSHFNTLLFPLAVAERLAERLAGSNRAATSIPPAWINAGMRGIFASERALIGRMPLPFGLSLLALATPECPPRA